jgi:ADP-ribose pyrophosphatase
VATESSETVYAGRVFSIVRERYRSRDGQERAIEVVRHNNSVVLIPMPDPQSVVLVRQYRHAVASWLWELPAGTLERDESPKAAARRECEEETGFAAETVEYLGALYPIPGYGDEKMIFYKLTGLTRPEQPASPDEDEDLDAQTFSLDEARAMVRRGEIVDLKSAYALTLI